MTKWIAVVERFRASHRAAEALTAMPALMSLLEANYRGSGVLKRLIKQKLLSFCSDLERGTVKPPPSPSEHLVHVIKQLSVHSSASDANVRRWATISVELRERLDVLALLETFVSQDARIRQLAQTTLSWTLSECNRRGCPCVPYHGD